MNKVLKKLFSILLVFSFVLLIGCEDKKQVEINLKQESVTIKVNEEINFKDYFTILVDGKEIDLLEDYIISNLNIQKPGDYKVKVVYEDKEKVLKVIVIEEEKINYYVEITNKVDELIIGDIYTLYIDSNVRNLNVISSDESVIKVNGKRLEALSEGECDITCEGLADGEKVFDTFTCKVTKKEEEKEDLTKAFNKLTNTNNWNFKLIYTTLIKEVSSVISDQLSYDGQSILYSYEYGGEYYNDYVINDKGVNYYYCGYGDTYEKFKEGTNDYDLYIQYVPDMDFSNLASYTYTKKDGVYYFDNPQTVNDEILGEYEGTYTCESVTFELKNNLISKITFTCKVLDTDSNVYYTYIDTLDIFDYGNVNIDVESVKKLVSDQTPVETTKVSKFLDTELNVESGSPKYTADRTANSFDEIRGAQFLQADGKVTITSEKSYQDVGSVTLVVSTNQELGAIIKVKVGSKYFVYNGSDKAKINKTNFDVTNTITFTTEELTDGLITIELIPTAQKKSIYILEVSFSSEKGQTSEEKDYMEKQVYDESTFDGRSIQELLKAYEYSIGLLDKGNYNVLVVPVEFKSGNKYTKSQLDKLEKSFNGTSLDTGWQSVKTYYQISSYNKLNMTFDIQSPVTLSNTAKYYESYSKDLYWDDGDTSTKDGSMLILEEVLKQLESELDLTKYDNDNDGVIDGVYLIYNYDIDYDSDTSFYWAYVSWYEVPEDVTYDGLYPYYYLFASYYFTEEDAENGYEYSGIIRGLKINSTTYIHETGHMLSLDDYYDYYPDRGCNEGLGGSDMMDYNVGDHGSYSKILMGWVTPQIVTESKEITIKSFEETGDVILIPLKFNNSYMSEYLLIDLYTCTGLNKLHGDLTLLYGTSLYGVRIYHISSDVDDPYTGDFSSFTKYNNSTTNISLIKLIEADGETDFASNEGFASSTDLWLSGMSLNDVFPNYKRNDGKIINFNITIDSVSLDEAKITIEYK